MAGISDTTAYRTRDKLPDFAKAWNRALALAATSLEAIAFQRATVGAEEKIIRKGQVYQIKVKPSDGMLRLLMQGADPAKYGRIGGGRMRRLSDLDEEARRYFKNLAREELEEKYQGKSVEEVSAPG